MRFLYFSLLIFLPVVVLAQEEAIFYKQTLKQGEKLFFEKKSVKFKNVVIDSRCPSDVTCIWAGEAQVLVEVYEDGKFIEEKIISINSPETTLNFSSEEFKYSLNSLRLLPYPSTKNKHPKEYTLQMQVTEKLKK